MALSPANSRQSLVQDGALMTWPCRAVPKELQGQERSHGMPGRDHLRTRQVGSVKDVVERRTRAKVGRNRNRPPNLVRRCLGLRSSWRASATSAVTGCEPSGRCSSGLLREAGKPLILEDLGDDDGVEGDILLCARAADIVDAGALLAGGRRRGRDADPTGERRVVPWPWAGRSALKTWRTDQDAKASWGVAVAFGASPAPESFSTKKARRASYWRCVGLAGIGGKRGARSVSCFALPGNTLPQSQNEDRGEEAEPQRLAGRAEKPAFPRSCTHQSTMFDED